ncbi:hypothetical protein B0A49_01310 [Cryomyces minteri]|uniref:NAD(P)-binding domain-containing protein n=1 Tax=Cryomyces minteri TaxID=331657 RepID=A0A4U0XLL9_9PEZI|nr:hypothetical protein B0A49_01310 [Cryomyces minteri]
MPTALVFGGSGKTARHITRILVSKSYAVHSIIRNPSQTPDLESLGAKSIVQSIEEASVQDLVKTIRAVSPSVVIWAAGAGAGNPERTKTVDEEGAIKSFDAAAEAGVKRYVTISALDVRDRENRPTPDWYSEDDVKMSDRLWGVIKPFMLAKLAADRNLVTENGWRGLEYTIVRPGGLKNEPGKGTVSAGKVHLGTMVSREDVAAAVVAVIDQDETKGLAIDVVGGDTAIDEAIKTAAQRKVNCFDGYH